MSFFSSITRTSPRTCIAGEGWSRWGGSADRTPRAVGFTLSEMLVVVVILALLAAVGLAASRTFLEWLELDGATRAVRTTLAEARALAIARHAHLRLRLGEEGDLWIVDADGRTVERVHTGPGGPYRLDSVRIAPWWGLRYNERGQGSAGSVYLFRGRRGVRLVSNFLGRVRQETFSVP